jgi:hypothetical protein
MWRISWLTELLSASKNSFAAKQLDQLENFLSVPVPL